MSWSIHAMPVGVAAARELVDVTVRDDEPVPTVGDVLTALRDSGCCGDPWFDVEGVDVGDWFSGWDPARGDDYVGEVNINPPRSGRGQLTLTTPVESIALRKPSRAAMLELMCELARVGGCSLVVFDDDLHDIFVVRPGDRPETHS